MATPILFQVVSQVPVVVDDSGANISYSPGQVFSADPQNQSIVRLVNSHQIVPVASSTPPATGFIVIAGPPGPAGSVGPQGIPGVGAPTPLSVPNGGTGLATIPTSGQLLIGNGVAYTLAGLTGTANQVIVTNGAGSITLSAPQNIHSAATPTFASLTLSGLTANAFAYSGAAGLLSTTAAPTNGQLLIGSTGLAPVLGVLTGTASQVVVTNGAGTITLSLPQSIAAASSPTFAALTLTTPLTVPNGGTGAASLTSNGILLGSGAAALTATAAPTNGQVLVGSTGLTPVLATLTGTASQVIVTNGAGSITLSLPQSIAAGSSPTFTALTLSGLTANAFAYSGAAGLLSSTAAPTNGQLLIGSTGLAPVAAAITGTANQIVVTNGAGTITLSAPQAIGTASAPQFAALGIGAAAGVSGLTLADANNLILGTVTGTMFGSTALQKLAFFGAAPVVQIAGSVDVLAGLVTLGLRAASVNPPLNIGTGAFTGGSATFSNTTSQVVLGATNLVTLSSTAQTVGATTLTIPNFAGVSDTFAFLTLAQTLVNKTISGAALTGTFSGTPTFSGTVAFTASSPLSLANAFTLTLATTVQTVGGATLTVPNFAGVSDTFAFVTLAQTLANKTLTAPTISGGGSLAGTFTGTPTLSGTVAFTASSPLSIFNAQTLTLSTAAQTVGGATLTVPNFAGVSDTFAFVTLAQTLANKTLTAATLSGGGSLAGTFTGTPTLSGTVAFTASSPFSIFNAQTLTLSTTAQTVGGATLTIPNFASVSDTFAFVTLAQTLANKTLTAATLSGGGSLAGTFTGTPTLSGTVAFTNTSPFSVANAQILTLSTTAQTVGAATLTIPNFAGVSDTFVFLTLAQTLANKTLTTPTINGAATSGTFSGTPTFSGTVAFSNASPLSIANAQTLTISTTAQTVGGATLTVPNFAGVADTFAFLTLAQTLQNKTIDASTSTNANTVKLNVAAYAPTTNPAGTASTTQVMAGLAALTGGPAAFTPRGTGRVQVQIQGTAANSVATDGSLVQIRYGTGAAPVNGAAATGTAVGNPQTVTSATASASCTVSVSAVIPALSVGTAYWFDLGEAAVTGGTATLSNLMVTFTEL